ncbi:hypothetical protein X946_5210 [Burkholderia sp. ABCPW 111]|nr:hypothetical protein X946_5210 [Burkholderia sp. ABCPW 111]
MRPAKKRRPSARSRQRKPHAPLRARPPRKRHRSVLLNLRTTLCTNSTGFGICGRRIACLRTYFGTCHSARLPAWNSAASPARSVRGAWPSEVTITSPSIT